MIAELEKPRISANIPMQILSLCARYGNKTTLPPAWNRYNRVSIKQWQIHNLLKGGSIIVSVVCGVHMKLLKPCPLGIKPCPF